ncbi:MAG: hypothetical protein QM734_06745 [Cyclobacteriaceae bacterium]
MNTKPFFKKLILCLFGGLVCGETFFHVGDKFLIALTVPASLVVAVASLLILASIIYAVVWHFKDKKTEDFHTSAIAFWISAIQYGIAFNMALFGFQRIFHMQPYAPLGMLDEPFSSFSNQWLTWGYFGRSYGFICVIGILQIIGGFILIFNRTRLLGAIMILPIMISIILIDYFYDSYPSVLRHDVIIFLGVIYLLFTDIQRLVEFFFETTINRNIYSSQCFY